VETFHFWNTDKRAVFCFWKPT